MHLIALSSFWGELYASDFVKFAPMRANISLEEAFGRVIRELRNSANLSQEKLAERSQLDRSYISQIECGHRQPTLITIFQLAKSLNISPAQLMALVEQKHKK